jgi:hypothetical protein
VVVVVAGWLIWKSTRPPVLGEAFRSKVVTVCQHALDAKKAQGPFPFPDFNPTRPDPRKLPMIASFEAGTVSIYQRWMHDMLALGQPASGRTEWADLLKALRGHVRVIEEQQAAAERGDTQTFTKDYYAGNRIQQDMEQEADAAGVPVCAVAAAA